MHRVLSRGGVSPFAICFHQHSICAFDFSHALDGISNDFAFTYQGKDTAVGFLSSDRVTWVLVQDSDFILAFESFCLGEDLRCRAGNVMQRSQLGRALCSNNAQIGFVKFCEKSAVFLGLAAHGFSGRGLPEVHSV